MCKCVNKNYGDEKNEFFPGVTVSDLVSDCNKNSNPETVFIASLSKQEKPPTGLDHLTFGNS